MGRARAWWSMDGTDLTREGYSLQRGGSSGRSYGCRAMGPKKGGGYRTFLY